MVGINMIYQNSHQFGLFVGSESAQMCINGELYR